MVATVASIDVTLKLLGADAFQARMRDSGAVSEQTGARVKRAMDGISASTDRVSRAADGLNKTSTSLNGIGISAVRAQVTISDLNRNFSVLSATVAGLAGGTALNAFRNYADTATNIGNRLAAVLPVQAERAKIDEKIFDTAQRTRTSYEATANLFSRLSLSSSQLGASQSDILKVVETTQKALQAGGATVSESASVATQLTQALGSGRLAGDELKSLAENSPVLIQAIAKEFGVTVGALKDMGANGELVASRVFKAILNAGAEVDEVFSRIKPSIAAGIQQIDNALTRYIGNADKSIGITKVLSGALESVAKNIDTIGDSAAIAVAALAGPIGSRVLGGAASRVAAPFRDARTNAVDGAAAARASVASTGLAKEAAQAGLREAEKALHAFDDQPRFRQAAPDLQRSYEAQAAQVNRLREASFKMVEREAAALLKRADAEGVVAAASQAAAARVEATKGKLAYREATLNDLLAKRPALEQAAAQEGTSDRSKARLSILDGQIERQRAAVASQVDKVAAAEIRANESVTASAQRRARMQAELDAAALTATAQRRAASQALQEAEGRLGGLADQVGPSAALRRTQAVEQVTRAQEVTNRAVVAEQDALKSSAAATSRTSAAKIALAGAAGTAQRALGGLVNVLGGPLGAALTAAAVGYAGYEIYQARAAAQVEKHTAAVDKLIESTKRLNDLNAQGRIRTLRDQVDDLTNAKDATKASVDSRNALKGEIEAALKRAAPTGGYIQDSGGGLDASRPLTAIDTAAAKAGLSIEHLRARLDQIPPGTKEAAQVARQLADALLAAGATDARIAPIAARADDIAKAWEKSTNAVDSYAKALQNVPKEISTPLDMDRVKAPTFSAAPVIESTKAQLKEIKDQLLSLGDTDIDIRGLDTSREQIAGFTQDIVEARANAMGMLSGQSVPAEINDLVQAFGNGKISVENYATSLEEVGQRFPNFQPLIDSLVESAQKALSDSAAMADLATKVKGLDGLFANILIKIGVSGKLPDIGALAATEQAKADAALNRVEQGNRVLALRAGGKDAEANVLAAKQANPALDEKRALQLYAEQERLNDQIAANKKASRGAGRKTKEERDGDTLAKKLRELDQDTAVSGLNDFDQKTVRFAQSAKVATDQIQQFITAAKAGDLSGIPPTMQEIYDKMRQLEGVKLGKQALEEIFPGRLLVEQLESVRRAAAASPEIAANLDQIEQKMRAKAAPEWAQQFSSGFTDMAKSIVNGTATAADALQTFKTKVVNIALDVAFKPIETALKSLLGSFTSGTGGGIGGFFTSLFAADGFVPGYGSGRIPAFSGGTARVSPSGIIGAGGNIELPA